MTETADGPTWSADELLQNTTARFAPDPAANRLVPLIAHGTASRESLAALALEQHHVIAADLVSFRHLAERAGSEPECAAFFTTLADGEELAREHLGPLLAACGVDAARVQTYEPLAGCQAYPAYVAWLALNGSPANVVLALTANFAAWGGCCARIAEGLRAHYGFGDEACAFFDFFAAPAPGLARRAEEAVRAARAAGRVTEEAQRHGRLLQAYEAMFWETLAEAAAG